MTAWQHYQRHYPGESWTQADIDADIRETCFAGGWTAGKITQNPGRAEYFAVGIWEHQMQIEEMMDEYGIEEY